MTTSHQPAVLLQGSAGPATAPSASSPPPSGPAPEPPPGQRDGRRRGRLLAGAGAVAVLAAAGAAVAVTSGGGSVTQQASGAAGQAGSDPQTLVVTATTCGNGWSLATTGAAAFAVSNQAGKSVEITLRSTADDAIIAEIEGLPKGVTRQLSTTVNPGTYYWLCQFRDSTTAKSGTVTVSGPTVAVAEPLLEVTEDDMGDPVAAYKKYTEGQLSLLRSEVATLKQDVTSGNTAKAKADWITAHQTYHRIGAAYNAFGDDGEGVDGLAAGLAGGTSDPDFTGFHQIEKLLWSGASTADLTAAVSTLAEKVDVLVTKLPEFTFDPNDISLRTHEILEGTARFQLTGQDDYGSGTSLATAAADVDGTRTLMKILFPLVDARTKGLPERIGTKLDALTSALNATKVNGQWVAVSTLPLAKRQQLNALTGGVLEDLSVIPDMLEIRA